MPKTITLYKKGPRIKWGGSATLQPNGKLCTVDDVDFDRVLAAGYWLLDTLVRKDGSISERVFKHVLETGRKGQLTLSRFILGHAISDDITVLFNNGNGLDCQRSNLTVVPGRFNLPSKKKGTSKYRGVYFNRGHGKWQARITINKKLTYLGYYDTEIAAAQAFDRTAVTIYGASTRALNLV